MLPSDFDIFSFSTKRCSMCTQNRENGWGGAASPLVIETRELAVVGQRGDLEVGRAVARVGMTVAAERGDQITHRAKVGLVGRARHLLRRLDAELFHVLAKRADPWLRVLRQLDAR